MQRYAPASLTPLFCLALLVAAGATTAFAQERYSDTGLGGQIGEPSGVTLKLYQRPTFAYEFLAAWDLDDFFFLNVHGLYERPIQNSPLFYYLGPGAFIGFEDRGREDDVVIGVSGNFGVNFFTERFEVFLQVTPRLSVIPETDGDIGGGVGLRYYF